MTINRTTRLRPEQLGRLERLLAKEIPRAARAAAMKAARQGVRVLKRATYAVRPYPPIDTKRFVNAWEVRGGTRSGDIVISNPTRYAGVIEGGRRAGARMPPVSALIPWVVRKFGIAPEKARGIAFAVAKKIGERGIAAKRIAADSRHDVALTYAGILSEAVDRVLGDT